MLHFGKNMCIHFLCAVLAQLVEQRIRNAWVGGSTPLNGTIFVSDIRKALPTQSIKFMTMDIFVVNQTISKTYKIRMAAILMSLRPNMPT